jgi:uncharacterized protein YabE (DUF348 family)
MLKIDSPSPAEGIENDRPAKRHLRTVPSPAIIILIIALLLSGVVFAGFAWARKTVTLSVDGKEMEIKTFAFSVGELLKDNAIVTGPMDRVLPAAGEQLVDGARVVLLRAHHVTISADGEMLEFDTTAATVEEALKEKKITPGVKDIVTPEPGHKITEDTEIKVTRVKSVEEVKHVSIPYSVQREVVPQIARGITRSVKKGVNGKELQRWQVTYHDSQVVESKLVERKTVAEPVTGIVQVGSGQTVSRGGMSLRFNRAMEVVSTAYTYTGRNTASGKTPRYGLVAVDPKVISFGTKLYIDGYGYAEAADKGRDIKGNRVDVFLETASDARRWGVRRVNMYILE